VHDGEHVYRRFTTDPNKRFPSNSHPVVRTHPVSGRKALFANAQYVTRINELPKVESDAVLAFLAEHCANAAFHVRFRWQPHSVALWDNRCTEHYAIWDYFPQKRSGYRVTIKGDKPF
jgi:taurine dioxygenase